jgi:hypothetical protein
MQIKKYLIPLGCAALLVVAHRASGWPGVAAVSGGLLMWLLLHFTRLMTVLKRAAHRPIGHVDSAVMLNAKLKPGATLMHVIAMTRALGQRMSVEGAEPEVYRWTDNGLSTVEAEFQLGKLVSWRLDRSADTPSTPTPEPGGPAP